MANGFQLGGSGQGGSIHNSPGWSSQMTQYSLALDSAFVFNSSGDCMATSFIPDVDGTLEEIWVAVLSLTGAWGSTDGNLNFEIREGFRANYTPENSAASVGSGTIPVTTGDADIWRGATGLSIALTANRAYAIVIGDADGGASNYCTLRSAVRIGGVGMMSQNSSTNTLGFSTTGSGTGYPACVIVKFNGRYYAGAFLTTSSAKGNNAYESGVKLRFPEKTTVVGVSGATMVNVFTTSGAGNDFRLYADGVAPGGTLLKSWNTANYNGNYAGLNPFCFFDPADWYELQADTTYRFVVAPPTNQTTPNRLGTFSNLPSGAWEDIIAGIGDSGIWNYTIDDGAGGWTDTAESTPQWGPTLLMPETVAGGGGTRAWAH